MKSIISILKKKHQREEFNCGHDALNSYLKTHSGQDVRKNLTACFVLTFQENERIYGFYTLSSTNVISDSLPEKLSKKVPPSYKVIPAVLLGRLAVDISLQGQGYGEILLMNAFFRIVETTKSIAAQVIVVDPIDDAASLFYKRYGIDFIAGNTKMFIPIETVKKIF
jgi:predicted GNAT family N-acyltransferase